MKLIATNETEEITFTIGTDPYGEIIAAIKELVALGVRVFDGRMSEGEHQNLIAVEEFLRTRDNY